MNCPRCRSALVVHQAPRLVMNCCMSCGGIFLDGGASQRVVEALDPNALAASDELARRAAAPVATDATIPCPVCAQALERMPIAAAGVTVDACRAHGVWFDRDELSKVVRAVAPGAQPAGAPPVPQGFGGASANVPYVAGAPVETSAPVSQPQYSQPQYSQPQYSQPQYSQPQYSQPQYSQPQVSQSQVSQPSYPQPATPQPMAGAPSQALPPGMAPGQYVAPGWLEGANAQPGAQAPGGPMGAFPGAPGQPGQPGQPAQGWGLGKTALAVGAGVAAVAGVAYVASHTDVGRNVMGTSPSAQGFGAVGEVLSMLF